MKLIELNCAEFAAQLSSKAPTPGGGSAAALVGALGAALGCMVGNLTLGKKKYAAVQDEIAALLEQTGALQAELLDLVRRDAEAFTPLAQAYGLPQENEEQQAHKRRVMEAALDEACAAPLRIMEVCVAVLELQGRFARQGSTLAVSDAGAGAALCQGALRAAALNVFINTKAMRERGRAEALNNKAERLLEQGARLGEAVYGEVLNCLR